jgi:ferredoxin-type protein NapH
MEGPGSVNRDRPNRALLLAAAGLGLPALAGSGVLCLRLGETAFAVSIFLLGISLGPCLGVYAVIRRKHKQAARRVVLVTGGLSILAFALLGSVNLDLEGFFMLLFRGTMGAAVGHTLITVIVGPMLFGRFLCGWGCWRGMILELLPIRASTERRRGAWRLLPLAGLATSAGGAATAVFIFGHHAGGVPGAMHGGSLAGIVSGFAIYYAAAIGLAFLLKDQRAFCKYLCPSSVILGLTGRLSLLKMASKRARCNDCGSCSRVCPMGIDVARFASQGARVASGQCILCQKCAHACPTGALSLSAGLGR